MLSTAAAHGAVGRGLTYLNCNVAPILKGVSEINPTVNLLVGLLNPPNKAACEAAGILNTTMPPAARARRPKAPPAGGLFSGLDSHVFGQAPVGAARPHRHQGSGGGA